MKRLIICVSLLMFSGCTLFSSRLAQESSIRVQAVKDGVHRDMFEALSREQYEVARLRIENCPEEAEAALKDFAEQRDFMVEWDRDYERANAFKYVTVDSKLYSEQGILNYLGNQFSDKTKVLLNAVDKSKAATQPGG